MKSEQCLKLRNILRFRSKLKDGGRSCNRRVGGIYYLNLNTLDEFNEYSSELPPSEPAACHTDITPTQPHRNSNTRRNKNTRPMW